MTSPSIAKAIRRLDLSQRALELLRGGISPTLARLGRAPDYDIGRTLLLSGFPRSGTTWLAEILTDIPGTGLVFEPFNVARVPKAAEAGCDWENFVATESEWPSGRGYVEKVLTGEVLTRWTAAHLPLSRAWRADRWIVKCVRANQMLAWIIRNFAVLPPILLIRHPCAVYDSWLRRGWPIHRSAPKPEFRFFQAYPHLKEVIPTLRTPEEFFVSDWCMHHYTPLHQLTEGTFQLCFYEQLRADGVREMTRIFGRWGLPLPSRLAENLARPSAKASATLHREGTAAGWQTRLGAPVIARMLQVLERFGLDFYGTESKPKTTPIAGQS